MLKNRTKSLNIKPILSIKLERLSTLTLGVLFKDTLYMGCISVFLILIQDIGGRILKILRFEKAYTKKL